MGLGTNSSGVAPVTSSERVGELDVLRGFALLGVLIANFIWFSFSKNTTTEAQLDAFNEISANVAVTFWVDMFVSDKANTLFAFLFGVGFWVQMERLKARNARFEAIYLRRLAVLLAFGVINILLIWPWDILNLYAITGMLLFSLRNMSARTMLFLGLFLTLVLYPLMGWIMDATGLASASDVVFSDEAVIARQDAFVNGTFADWVGEVARLDFFDWVASGLVFVWVVYALGRFLIGAYVARKGWLQRSVDLQPQIRRICLFALPLGLVIEAFRSAISADFIIAPDGVEKALHVIGVPILDLGYATGLLVLFHAPRWKKIPLVFAPVGRMALTNYLTQGVFIGLILYGFHGGLGLAGKMEPRVVLPLCFGFYYLQMVFSRWWLQRFAFGPMEWLWRALTYGQMPQMRRAVPA